MPPKQEANSNSEKSFDEIYQELGVFSYDNEGFTISNDGFSKKILWADIKQLNVFKVDLITVDRIDMEIVLEDFQFTITEELPGWYQFVLKAKKVFPEIPEDWDITIIQPAFAANFRTIYKRTT